MKIQWLTLALLDMKQIREYIGQENPEAAMKIGDRLEAVTIHLAPLPGDGESGAATRHAGVDPTRTAVSHRLPRAG